MENINCKNNCCTLNVMSYHEKPTHNVLSKTKKAGVILHNVHEDKILLIQSRGNLWGFPKGSFEKGETFKQCAIRECFEETGIQLDINLLNTFYKINDDVCYYYVIFNEQYAFNIQKTNFNDATGIGWIKIECLTQLIENNDSFKINFHAKKCIFKFFKKNFLKKNSI